MIGVQLQGRLGNQLFQYAFAYAAAKKLRTGFYLDQAGQPLLLREYFHITSGVETFFEENVFSIKGFRNIFSHRLKIFFYDFLKSFFTPSHVILDAGLTYKEVSEQLKDKTFYTGYFQSEKFFIEQEIPLRTQFSLKKKYSKKYHVQYDPLFSGKKVIAVHIRKDDYLKLGHLNLGGEDLSIPVSYYHRVVAALQSADALFVILSDDIPFVTTEFAYVNNKVISRGSLIEDFQHLMNADICVIGNSTFSWWGAWLNEKPQKEVYAPEFFLGHHVGKNWPPEIYPGDWHIVNVNNPVLTRQLPLPGSLGF